ncbi:MAG TPA: DNA mismatch repair protein MutS [Pyrinomonadaceae bacterium]|nr:DNA mismatch repair protein MutS [Pyrinomonadaceae bacterium]
MDDATPMLRQYLEIKKQYPGTLLMFRLGDFYELFKEDALVGARELQITLTARQKDSKNPIPMCGVPHHAAANYISKLVRKGYRVAICEQAEPSAKGTKLVRREVVRVITPGTAIEPQLLENKEPVYLASIFEGGETIGVSLLELSTGEFISTQLFGGDRWQRVRELLEAHAPRELIFPSGLSEVLSFQLNGGSIRSGSLLTNPSNDGNIAQDSPFALTGLDDDDFDLSNGEALLCSHFRTRALSGFGLENKSEAIRSAAACLRYARFTQKAAADHVSEIRYFEHSDCLVLDQLTLRNLDILQPRNEGSRQTLLTVIDETVTGMGGRLVRAWLLRPSLKRSEIETRLAAVDELLDAILRDKVRFLLKQVSDLERLVGRLNLGSATARDLNALAGTLAQTPKLSAELQDASSLLLQVLSENIFELPEIRDLITSAIVDEPPAVLSDGGTIRDGFNAELDELRSVAGGAKRLIAEFEEKERQRTGISTLKIRFNNVFGYYIEVSRANSTRVPDDYHRRQTLTNAERFTTPQLKEWEDRVLGAESRISELEAELFQQIRIKVKEETHRLQTTARALATLDALASLAETAARRNYVRPVLHDGDEIEIKSGRHAIVEASMPSGAFVPNDIYLNNSTDRLLIVTGANMGGKSTVLRQVALIQILAQIGSFVPASSARLPILDRIWTRVGASDDLASGRSTFMVEMTETAAILHNASPRSLVLLDEIGRGTSTFDGLSIAWAVAEYLHDSPEHAAKTIFATHYHEMTELAEDLSGAKNYQMTASEQDGEVVFLHKLEKGTAARSYGIAVARLAGLPASVLNRAENVLERLERYELAVFSEEAKSGQKAAAARAQIAQHSLFEIGNETVLAELRDFDLESHSPEETISFLAEIKKKIN